MEPMLYVGCGESLDFIGVEEAFESGDLYEQRVAISGLIAVSRVLQRGPQLDNDPRGLTMSKHHWWGGPENAPQIADCRISRHFYNHPDNKDSLRRDVHTFIEQKYGWPVLPHTEQMIDFIEMSESNIPRSVRKAIRRYRNG